MNTHYLTTNTIRLLTILTSSLVISSCTRHNKDIESDPMPTVSVAYPICDSVTLYKRYPGYISAQEEVPIVARVSGTLLSSDYEAGSYIPKGKILFTIEDTKYRDALQQAEATLANANSAYDYAVANYKALTKAFESDAVSRIEVLEAESTMRQCEANIKEAKAALETARTNLSYCVVKAPTSGKITKRNVDPGTFVDGAANAVDLAKIYNDATMTATFNIEDRQYIDIIDEQNNNHSASMTHIPILFSQPLPHAYFANLSYTSPNIETGTGTLLMQAHIPNKYGELKSGMFVTVDLPYATNPKAIMIKDAAIGTDQRGNYIYTLDDDNQVTYTPIILGELVADTMRIVKSGISDKNRYITKAMLKVRPGEKVRPIVGK